MHSLDVYFTLTCPGTFALLQGVRQIKATNLNPVYLFISPPDMASLKERLRSRGTETEASLQKRLNMAIREVEYAQTGAHDLILVNDSLDRVYDIFKRVALGESVPTEQLPSSLLEPDSPL